MVHEDGSYSIDGLSPGVYIVMPPFNSMRISMFEEASGPGEDVNYFEGDQNKHHWTATTQMIVITDEDVEDNFEPSCSEEEEDHVNCRYEDGIVCVCGGSADIEEMVWQCVTCPRPRPDDGDDCDVVDLQCDYSQTSCVCELDEGDRTWDCD